MKAEGIYERALKTFEKVSRAREKEKGFGNRDTLICNFMKVTLLTDLKRVGEAKQLLGKLCSYSRVCLKEEDLMI